MGGGEKSDKDKMEEEDTDNEASVSAAKDDDDEENSNKIQLGPQCTLKEHIEKDKDDESLRRWKEQLLGAVDFESVGGMQSFTSLDLFLDLEEAEEFQGLLRADTCKSLIHIFFAQRGTSKVPGVIDRGLVPIRVTKVAVIGGGLMGSGITTALILSKLSSDS